MPARDGPASGRLETPASPPPGTLFYLLRLRLKAPSKPRALSGARGRRPLTVVDLLAINLKGCPAALPTDWACLAQPSTFRDFLIGPGAKVAGADLTLADMSGQTLSAVDWTGTVCPDGVTAAPTCCDHLIGKVAAACN